MSSVITSYSIHYTKLYDFDLLDEVEEELKISVRPLSWPIGNGTTFQGVYNIFEENLNLFEASKQTVGESIDFSDINNPELENYIGKDASKVLREEFV